MDYTEDDVRSLADKIDGLDLGPGEQAALSALLDAAADDDDEVAGFGFEPTPFGNRMLGILVVSVSTTMGGTGDGVTTQMGGTPEGFGGFGAETSL